MLHAAAMLIGLFALGLLAKQNWSSSQDLALVFAAAVACVVLAARFGGIGRSPFSYAPQMLFLFAVRARTVLRGALATVRTALAADISLKPALVRVRTQDASAFCQAALVNFASAAPGAVVVDADDDGLLVHVVNEDAIDDANLKALEALVVGALERRRTP
jgi:multisubunit Na+/H+ antiporter MnhE subunit